MNTLDMIKFSGTLGQTIRSRQGNKQAYTAAKRLQVFNPLGAINASTIATPEQGYKSFVTIYDTNNDSVWLASAPLTGVSIKQLTDYSVTKALSNDFLVTTFGDTPVQIDLSGLNFFNLNGCELGSGEKGKQQILSFYKKNKISANFRNRFSVAIASGADGKANMFRCVLVAMNAVNDASAGAMDTGNKLYSYTMTLIGVSS